MTILRELRDYARLCWAWYMFPVLEALGLRQRTENLPGDEENYPHDPDQESPLQPENPSLPTDHNFPIHD